MGLSGCHWGSVKVIRGSVGVIKLIGAQYSMYIHAFKSYPTSRQCVPSV